MAKEDKVRRLKERSKRTAEETLKEREGFPIAPRKAMAHARKASKKLPYPLPPYASANRVQLLRWAAIEWQNLGRWQRVALPVVALVALLTWEKERALQESYQVEVDKAALKHRAAEMYGAFGRRARKRKLLGIIP